MAGGIMRDAIGILPVPERYARRVGRLLLLAPAPAAAPSV
jgi:hypothetical protein